MIGYLLRIAASLVRAGAAIALVWLCWQDRPAIQARDDFEALEPIDFAYEAGELFKKNRFSEALVLVDEGLKHEPANNRLLIMKQGLELERKDWMRQLALGGQGALTGRGTEAASLGGAIIADLFVFGDIRDLIIETGTWLKGGDADDMIVALSAGGILLTVAPEVDLGAAVLKAGRKMGAVSGSMAKGVADAARKAYRSRKIDPIKEITDDVGTLSKRASPPGAVAMLKHIDDPATLRRIAKFVETPEGLHAMMVDPRTTMRWLNSGWTHAEFWVLKAGAKGGKGLEYLSKNSSMMFRAHPVIGLVKGLYKGNVPAWLLDFGLRHSLLMLGFAIGWLMYEGILLGARVLGIGVGPKRLPPAGPGPAPPEAAAA
ncbi:MAG: hypothetical protein ACT4PK_10855 [Gammaproteobacteria bacterium]